MLLTLHKPNLTRRNVGSVCEDGCYYGASFKFVEHKSFRECTSVVQPRFRPISCHSVIYYKMMGYTHVSHVLARSLKVSCEAHTSAMLRNIVLQFRPFNILQ
ncbi:hypothetical protein JHK84_027441 [Glycine max]|uniref:Uncharacterized protein n=1 Tax=Glycine soja TaxID=3848 RepID=A0A0B2SMD9_GLYSO|nr:hypothetical protein JHK85_027831 [Glycine max]KAG5150969.1 hypothetical protein JHK84_027441 [Glycine max]KHN46018.1 hypothetical protein glysoja_040936 [Glycine soja]